MKPSLLVLLAVAFGLTACTPAPASSSRLTVAAEETPAATAEEAPAENPETPAMAAGGIRGSSDLQQEGSIWYSIGAGDPTGEGFAVQLLALDCETGKQTVLFAPEHPVQQAGTPFARGGTVYLFADTTMYKIPATGGEAQTVELSEVFYPTAADEGAAYSFYFEQDENNYVGKRLDLQTGTVTLLTLPAQTYGVWAVNEPQVFLCRLITEAPLPSREEGEMYAAAMQNATREYGWYDLEGGTFQKVTAQPYYGEVQPDGTKRMRQFMGMADGRLYFVWWMRDEEGTALQAGIESCDRSGADWQPAAQLPQQGDAAWTLEQNGQLRWILGQARNILWVYDLADGQMRQVPSVTPSSDGWPSALTGNDRVLVSADPARLGDRFAMIDIRDFLAGSTDWMPLDLCGKPLGVI